MSAWLETVRPPSRSQAAAVAWTNLKRARHRREVRFGFICYLVPKLAFSRCLSSGSSAAEQDFIFRASTIPHYWHSGSTSCACGCVCGFSFSSENVKAPSSLNPCVLKGVKPSGWPVLRHRGGARRVGGVPSSSSDARHACAGEYH